MSAVVLALDEERHLPGCLATLGWADEVLVVDAGSHDGTRDAARAAGARVETHPFANFSLQRQRALELASHDWVLFVDADERVSAALADEARGAAASGEACGYWVPRRNVFWGHTMRGGGWWPDHQLRLLLKGRARYDPAHAVHEVAEVDGPTSFLAQSLLHLNYDSVGEFMSRQATYARLEAARRLAAGGSSRSRHLVTRPLREGWRRLVTLGGWRDGPTGLLVCSLMAWYELSTLRAVRRAAKGAAGRS